MPRISINNTDMPKSYAKENKKILLTLCIGFFMVIMDVNIVNIALPTIAQNLDGELSWMQWIVDGYTLTFACLLLTAGSLGDQISARTVYLFGLFILVLTSLSCGLVSNLLYLTIFRLLQGVGAAFIVPTSLSLIKSSFLDERERTTAIGVWASVGGVAAASGPIIGSLLTAWFGWRAVFLINMPIGLFGIFLTTRYIKCSIDRKTKTFHFDFLGQLLGIVSLASLAFAVIEAGRTGWHSDVVVYGLIIFSCAFFAFLIFEYHSKTPLFPLELFKSSMFSTSIVIGMIINLCGYGILFLLPFYFQNIKSYSILITGLAIAPFSILAVFGSYLAGKIAGIIGPKTVMMMGLLTASIGFFSLLIIDENTPYSFLFAPIILIGVGGAITMPSATIAAINSAPNDRTGIATGIFNTSRQIGSLVGVAFFGAIVNTSMNFVHGIHTALIVAGLTSLIGCFITMLWFEL